MPDADAKNFIAQMEAGSLVFVTKENEAEMRVAADMHEYFKEADRLKAEAETKSGLSTETTQKFESALAKAQERYRKDKQNDPANSESKSH